MIRSQICTCHNSSAVVTCANLWSDRIIKMKIRAIIFYKKISIMSSSVFCEIVPRCSPLSLHWFPQWLKYESGRCLHHRWGVLHIYVIFAIKVYLILLWYLIDLWITFMYKQRVLMHRHQGLNVRHGLCHIYMRYLYIYELFIAFVLLFVHYCNVMVYMWCIVWQVASKRKYRHVW